MSELIVLGLGLALVGAALVAVTHLMDSRR